MGIKGIHTAGQSPAPAACDGFPQQSCVVLNPSFPHSLGHVRASATLLPRTAATSLRSSINNAAKKQYEDSIKNLFPKGDYWDLQFKDTQSDINLLTKTKLDELLRFRTRMNDLYNESNIESCNDLIACWERVLLNDTYPEKTIKERRLLLRSKEDSRLNLAELQKIACIYGLKIIDITFPYRPFFFGHGMFSRPLCGFHAFSAFTIRVGKSNLFDECRKYIAHTYNTFGAQKMIYFPLKNYHGKNSTLFETMIANYIIKSNNIFNKFEQAINEKLLANHLPFYWYEQGV